MGRSVRAVVLEGPKMLRLQEFSRPDVGPDDGLLEIEGCGICGADVEQYDGNSPVRARYPDTYFPLIPGHEVVGSITEIGDAAAKRWGLVVGDRVALEPNLSCGRCHYCTSGRKSACTDPAIPAYPAYSQIPTAVVPSLWGGYSEMLFLHANSRLHKISTSVPIEQALLVNPIANGLQWAVLTPHVQMGGTALVLGPGQRGLASVIALKKAGGAERIIVSGLSGDGFRLELARTFGATDTILADQQDVAAAVMDITGGAGADLVVDVTAGAPNAVNQAVHAAGHGGTIVLAGTKDGRAVPEFPSESVTMKELIILGALSATHTAFALAVKLIESRTFELGSMSTHSFSLEQSEAAINTLAGRTDAKNVVAVSIRSQS